MRETGHPDSLRAVQTQYENFPYPPIPTFALPRRGEGAGLRYEEAFSREQGISHLGPQPRNHRGIRILIAGGGTLEPLVVAQAHPQAKEVVAIDLSQNSLDRLKKRIAFSKFARFPNKLPPIQLVRGDLLDPETVTRLGPEPFDYILASNVLHHVEQPAFLLKALTQVLRPGGIFRVVTYPKASRLWMNATSKWLKLHGLTQTSKNLVGQARAIIAQLPDEHPIRSCFESHPEIKTGTGIADAFLHSCENPLSPLEWRQAAEEAGLTLVRESQNPLSRASFLDEIYPPAATLPFWEKLQVLDLLLELCANPILWFIREENQTRKGPQSPAGTALPPEDLPLSSNSLNISLGIAQGISPREPLQIPSPLFWEMKENLLKVQFLLKGQSSASLEGLMDAFRTKVGPRVDTQDRTLKGLALSDFPLATILEATPPLTRAHWAKIGGNFEKQKGKRVELISPDIAIPQEIQARPLADQAEWLQLRLGAVMPHAPAILRLR